MSMKRVFHPDLPSWQDVPEADAKTWKEAGWRLTKPDHVDDSDAPEPGAYQYPALSVEATPVASTTAATSPTATGNTNPTAGSASGTT